MDKLEQLKKKIKYRSLYRGTKEMDLLLSSFVQKVINQLDFNELMELDQFLSLEDEVIYNLYQNNNLITPPINNKILDLFKAFNF